MGYSITIIGRKPFETADEAREFEQSVTDKARAFVGELEGVTTASATFDQLGAVTLAAEETTDDSIVPEGPTGPASEDPNNPLDSQGDQPPAEQPQPAETTSEPAPTPEA